MTKTTSISFFKLELEANFTTNLENLNLWEKIKSQQLWNKSAKLLTKSTL